MDALEIATHLKTKLLSTLEELGVEGFVFGAYVRDGDGKIQRICIVNDNADAAIEDGIRPLAHFAAMWSAPTQRPRAQPRPESDRPPA